MIIRNHDGPPGWSALLLRDNPLQVYGASRLGGDTLLTLLALQFVPTSLLIQKTAIRTFEDIHIPVGFSYLCYFLEMLFPVFTPPGG